MKKLYSIHSSELSLFLPLFGTLTLLTFNTKILKILKDTLIVTTPDIGAQLIPFLKVWGLIPISLLMISLLTRLQRSLSFTKVYTVITSLFLGFFSFYVFVMHPMGDDLYPRELTAYLGAQLPAGFKNFLMLIEYWPLTVFYVVCDMWSIMMVSLLFWRFANQVINMEQAKRFFPLFSIDLGGIIIGPLMAGIILYASQAGWEGGLLWEKKLQLLTMIVVGVGIMQMWLFLKLQRSVDKVHIQPLARKKTPPLKELWYFARSPIFGPLALVVFLFEFSDNLFDVLWKSTLGTHHPNPENFSLYLGYVTFASGILTTITPFVISSALLQRQSWFRVASITPILLMILSGLFFTCYFFPSLAGSLGATLGMEALALTVLVGAVQSCLMQVAKCTVFDNTKDLTFLLAPREEQAPARAFSDALATRLGKSSSCLAQQGLLMGALTLANASPYVACLIGLSIPVWVVCLAKVNKSYDNVNETLQASKVLAV